MSTATHERRWTLDYPELGTGPIPIKPYVSAEYFEQEREKVFSCSWLCVGRVEEIPGAGDYIVREVPICRASIIIVRGKGGVIRAFHNVCRHRATKVVWDEHGCATRFACKYHGWTYSTEGNLLGLPEEDMFFDFDKNEISLMPVAVDTWEGFIFINLKERPSETLQEHLGELVDSLSGYPFDKLPVCFCFKAELNCNWKVIVDSQQEGYHAKVLHRRSLPGFLTNKEHPSQHVVDIRLYRKNRLISYYGNRERKLTPVEALAYQFGTSVAKFASDLSGDKLPAGVNPARDPNWAFDEYVIFPNFHLLLFIGMYITHTIWPVRVDRAIWEARAYLPPAEDAGQKFTQEWSRCMLRDAWLEDGSTLEASQAGLASGAVSHFILQDQELLIRHFHKVLQDHIGC
jgi:Rieske 2Fe-2S family protein